MRITLPAFLVLAAAADVAAAPARSPAQGPPTVAALRVEYRTDPLGIDARPPRLSWQIRSQARGVMQTAYQVQVARDERALRAGRDLVWDSGRVASDASVHREYEGPALRSGGRYHWRVRVWTGDGPASAWSAPASWEMGLLEPPSWTARWIEPPRAAGAALPLLRREFHLRGPVASARAYVTAHGLYELHLNGTRVGDLLFTPGWTSYRNRLQYQTYDVTPLLRPGANVVGAALGPGWYAGKLGWDDASGGVYGTHVALLGQVRVRYRDGTEETVGTGPEWKTSPGPILSSEIYDGEVYDARREAPGWDRPGFDDSGWVPVQVASHRTDHLVAPAGPPVRRIEEIQPVKVLRTPGGDTVVDMGQNMVGWVRLAVDGPPGATVTLRHAEVLDRDGNFYTANLRKAKQTVRYTLRGGGRETFEPHFTFQGFRFVAVDGYPGELRPESLTGVVIHSDMPRTGEFRSSKPLLDRLQHNIVWGQKGNFLDVPTDCPQRDERMGWTGDAQAFARTAAFNMDVAGFFTKWLGDVAADQYPTGSVPFVVPDVLTRPGKPAAGSAAWADAAVIIPWTLYLAYGDTRILERQYDSMARWVEYVRGRAGEDHVWDGDFHFGDWLAYAAPSSEARSYPGATTGKDLIATAFYAHSTDLLQRASEVLGRREDAARYAALLESVKRAFVREYVSEGGRVGENTQTAYTLALHFDLLPEPLRESAARRLAQDVRTRKHLTTGFVGTPYLCHVLARYGYLDEAYLLLNREAYPSWLYPVTQGATTIWERWDGLKPDGTFQDEGMNSFNHYAYGAIGDWMYRVMAGIETDEHAPGYKHVLIQPRPGGGFTSVSASHETLYGRVGSAWTLRDGALELVVDVPPNTRATVTLPRAEVAAVTEGGRALAVGRGIVSARQAGTAVVAEVGSGQYRFAYPVAGTPF